MYCTEMKTLLVYLQKYIKTNGANMMVMVISYNKIFIISIQDRITIWSTGRRKKNEVKYEKKPIFYQDAEQERKRDKFEQSSYIKKYGCFCMK